MKSLFTDIRNIAGDFLWPEFCIAGADLKLVDVNGGVDVLLDDSLGNKDRVLEVVTIPRHEGHKNVATECELAFFGVRTVGNDIAFLDGLTFFDDRLLVNACARVGAHEFTKFVNIDAVFRVVLDFLFPFGK